MRVGQEKVLADAAAAAKAMADLAMTEDTVDFNKIGFMPLKKLLMEKGVPKVHMRICDLHAHIHTYTCTCT